MLGMTAPAFTPLEVVLEATGDEAAALERLARHHGLTAEAFVELQFRALLAEAAEQHRASLGGPRPALPRFL